MSASRVPASRPSSVRRPRQMPAALLTGLRKFEVREAPLPEPGAGEVLVELAAVGICGSDLHYWRQGRIGAAIVRYPQALGHEPAGVIVALGAGVRERHVGQRVAVEPGITCGRCRECLMGRANLCPNVIFLGMPGLAGAFQRYLVMPWDNTEPLPGSVSFALGAAAEPLGVAVQTFDLLGLRAGEHVAVIGGGPVGLCVAALARAQGATVVALADPHSHRRAVARALGVERTTDAAHPAGQDRRKAGGEDFLSAVKEATEGHGADLVAECAGAPDGLETAIQATARGGRVALVGIPEVDSVAVDPHGWRRKELVLLNVHRSNRALTRTLRVLGRGGLGLEAAGFFTGPVGLSAIQSACEELDQPQTRSVKVIVDPRME